LIRFESSAHWYGTDGRPQHDATLREARKDKLFPSVTTIDKDTFKNDFLERWKFNELVAAAADTFKQPHESPEDYANRIYEISQYKARTASNFGKEIHDAIENYPQLTLNTSLHPWIDRFGAWYEANVGEVISRERVLLDGDLGIAGRCDFIAHGRGKFDGSLIIPDWKTQNVKKDGKGRKSPAFYESWPRQLAFYAVSFAKETGLFPDHLPTCISVIIDSNEPCDPFVKVWTKEQILDNYMDFLAGAYLWFSKRNYWPVGKWNLNPSIRMPL
jgi:hypothetical protein